MTEEPSEDIEARVEQYVQRGDLGWVVPILEMRRDAILANWLNAVVEQPFHAGQLEHAVTDDIPRLYDALVAFLAAIAPRDVPAPAPLEDARVVEAARLHARARLDQGLEPPDIVVEFRVLRQEILAALRRDIPDSAPATDVLAASLLINDALDGAISVGLRTLVDLVESIREDFLATTIHDVRQPLTVIKGNAQMAARLLRRPRPDAEQVGDALRQIATLSDWMATLLDTLRDASRIALHQLDLDVGTVQLTSILQESIDRLGPDAEQRVRVTCPPELDARGQWDALRLGRVATNLLSNALKYSPPDAPIDVTVRGNENEVEFSVRDQGIGIDQAELPRLFQRYSRSTGAVERGIEGLGLGLYVSRGIVEAHGGRIWAESEGHGTGSTFHVLLPRRLPPVSESTVA